MKAKITKEYVCMPTGTPPELILRPGDIVEGWVAKWAVEDGHAEEIVEKRRK